MCNLKSLRNILCVALAVFAVLAVAAGAADVVSGSDLLRQVRQRDQGKKKAAYEDRSEKGADSNEPVAEPQKQEPQEPEPVAPVKRTSPKKTVKPTPRDPAVKPVRKAATDRVLQMIPADSLFCVRINNLDFSMGKIDQFLSGVLPIPGGVSMLARTQLVGILGTPDLKGVNTSGRFAAFGPLPGTDLSDPDNIGILVPVKNYRQFVAGNPNVSEPDDRGISKIAGGPFHPLLAVKVKNYALITPQGNDSELAATAKLIAAGKVKSLSAAFDRDQIKQSATKPVWVYANVQQISKTFGPMLSAQFEQIKAATESMTPPAQTATVSPAAAMNAYAVVLQELAQQTESVTVAIDPKPNVLTITKTVTAIDGTDMAEMFTADASAIGENKLLSYLGDGAFMNFAGRINAPLFQKLNPFGIDMLSGLAGETMTPENVAKMKNLAQESFDSLAGPVAFSAVIDAETRPPFALKYVIELRDVDKFNSVLDKSFDLWKNQGFGELYKTMGMETSYTFERNIATYKGVAINSSHLTMKSTDTNSPQGQMINTMYGEGFDYRWAIVDKLCVFAICGDVDSAVRELIDSAKAGGPKQIGAETKAALAILPGARNADAIATINYLRIFKIISAFSPMPMPQMDFPTKSNVAIASKAADGKLQVDIALPKQHLIEIMTAFQMIQQQVMQQQMSQNKEDKAKFEKIMNSDEGSLTKKGWTCSMHPQVQLRQKGRCPMCGMDLVSSVGFREGLKPAPANRPHRPGAGNFVQGQIVGTDVTLEKAKLERNQLALFTGRSWAVGPSILLFLFDIKEGSIPTNRSFEITGDVNKSNAPHVHYRWKDPKTGKMAVEVATGGKYTMTLKFGPANAGVIPGSIVLEVPDKNTRLEGNFRAKIGDR